MRFRKQFDEAAAWAAARGCDVDCSSDPGITSQSAARDLDINEIARRCGVSDVLDVQRVQAAFEQAGLTASRQATFGDFSAGFTLHEAMNRLEAGKAAFMDMPAKSRAVFQNNPAYFLDAVRAASGGDPDALKDLQAAGVAKLAETPPAQAAVPASAAAGPAGVSTPAST